MKETDDWSANPITADLKRQAIQGGAAQLTAQTIKFGLKMISVIVLARLLTPEDYGLFATVIAVTGLINMFNDLGLPMATIQSSEIQHRQVNALFWISVGMGCAMAAATAAAAPLVGWFYGEPRLTGMLVAMASMFAVRGLVSQPDALLRRGMRLVPLAVLDTGAMLLGVAAAITAALLGARYWSLVLMQVVTMVTYAAGVWRISRWKPSRPRRDANIRQMLGFGGRVTVVNFLGYLSRNVDDLLLGRTWGMRQLGFYDKAYQILLLPVIQICFPISTVALPLLSRLQNEPQRYRDYYLKIVLFTVALGTSLTAFLFVAAPKAVWVILGPQWSASVPIFQALAPSAFVDAFAVSINWLHLSMGHGTRLLRQVFVVSIITVVGIVLGLPWGALGVALAYSISRLVVLFPVLLYATRTTPIDWRDALAAVWRPALAAVLAAAALSAVMAHFSFAQNQFIDLAVDAAIYFVCYAAVWLLMPGGRKVIDESLQLVRLFKKQKVG